MCVCVGTQMETNPVLKNITDYLIEEVSAEEEELTGAAGGGGGEAGDGRDPASADVTVETDEKLLKVGGANVTPDAVAIVSGCLRHMCVCAHTGAGPPPALPASRPLGGLLQLL